MSERPNQLREERIKNLEALKEAGENPFSTYAYPVDTNLRSLHAQYDETIEAHEHTEDFYRIAGRVVLQRDMGGLQFYTIQDEDSRIQIAFVKKELDAGKFKQLKYVDMGDIIGVYGHIGKTKKGELSLFAKEYQVLSKCLNDLGDKYHGVQDIEKKYRNRSVDMIVNPDSKAVLKNRFIINQKIREFMIKEGFLEIETPITQPYYGGAAAKPFMTYHHELDMNLYLRVALEQALKRVMVGGMEAIFEIGKNFRNESIDRTHNPEFTMLEAYKAYVDYEYMMDMTERLTEFLAKEVLGTTKIKIGERELDVKAPWKRISIKEALKQTKDWDVDSMTDEELFAEVDKLGETMNKRCRGEALLILFEEYGEALGVEPTHFIDYPKESSPFCKQHRQDDELIERCESFIGGMEIANMYSELNDPVRQRELLEEQEEFKKEGAEEVWGELDEDFLDAMDYGLPPAGGIGIGIDRIVMVLLNQDSIRDIIYFPTMKPKSAESKEES